MNTSLFLAKVIGLYFIITSIIMLIKFEALMKTLRMIAQEPAYILLLGILTLILGLLMVVSHNVWVLQWPVIITVIAWTVLLAGVFRMLYFDRLKGMALWWQKHPNILKVILVLYVILGFFLVFKGFIG